MQTAFLKPRSGFIVRDPATYKPLDAGGEVKTLGSYWRRRIKDGDVTIAQPDKGGKTK